MSDLVAKARAALDGVTPGPWCVADETVVLTQINEPIETTYDIGYPLAETKRQKSFWTMANWPEGEPEANARFIAAARSLVPEMADEIARLRAEVERLREAERTAWERGRDAAAEVAEDMNPDIWDYHTGNRARIGTDPVAEAIRALTPETSHD